MMARLEIFSDIHGDARALERLMSVEADYYFAAGDLATWSQGHVRRIAAIGGRYGLELDPEPAGDPSLLRRVRQEVGDRLGRRSAPTLLLLRDLRSLYMDASGVSVDWELIAQAAQGVRDRELLDLASSCHPDTLRQARWANAMLKQSATQALVS